MARKPWHRDPSQPDARLRGRAGQRQRKRRLARTNGLCEECLKLGRYVEATIVNHVIPLARGGEDVDENTENLCARHDEIATAKQFGRKVTVAVDAGGWPTDQVAPRGASKVQGAEGGHRPPP
ncbi:MAG TPA: HNH endonuclease signature motif containing protein [Xanthobacteraceae bacterium]|nr:HNH endonuclease signature motif containing protein [Xanthobacteraceae bacterium]